jgi:hypothetical protein
MMSTFWVLFDGTNHLEPIILWNDEYNRLRRQANIEAVREYYRNYHINHKSKLNEYRGML